MAYPTKTDRGRILTAAVKLVEDGGAENLAIRSVASELGVAPNALYYYFESLAALMSALAEEARLQMLEVMQTAADNKGPAETILAISAAYVHFAREHPRMFDLYLKTSGVSSADPHCTRNAEFFLQQVVRVYGQDRAWDAAHVLWAFLHGTAVLREAGVLGEAQLSSGFKFGLDLWLNGAPAASSTGCA